MTYKSKVLCDGCQREHEAPGDGGFPFGWAEVNYKAPKNTTEMRTRFHLCSRCCTDVVCIGDMISARVAVAAARG